MDMKKINMMNMANNNEEVVANVGFSNSGIIPAKPKTEEYPYCLRMYLGDSEIKKLGLEELPELGSVVHLMAMAKVVATRDDGMGKTMELQITDMSLGSNKKKKSIEESLYGSGEKESEEEED